MNKCKECGRFLAPRTSHIHIGREVWTVQTIARNSGRTFMNSQFKAKGYATIKTR